MECLEEETVYLVDGCGILFRCFYAIPMTRDVAGNPTNAIKGFIKSLERILRSFSPRYLAVVMDGKDNKKDRRQIYSEYKKNRKPTPRDIISQTPLVQEFCNAAGICHMCVQEAEADDVIGTIAKNVENSGMKVVICSSDKDFCQLVSRQTSLLNIYKNNSIIDEEGVEKIFGILPSQIVDYLAMVGDVADNIPGIPGFGPKTSSALLREFSSLKNIIAAKPSTLSDKKIAILEEYEELALISQQLAKINTNVAIENFDVSSLRIARDRNKNIVEFYQKYDI